MKVRNTKRLLVVLALLMIFSLVMDATLVFAKDTDEGETEEKKKGTPIYTREEMQTLIYEKNMANFKVKELEAENKRLKEELARFSGLIDTSVASQVPVLLYHHLLPQADIEAYGWGNNSSVVSVERFREEMKYLKDNGFYTATLDEVEKFAKGEIELPKKTVAITFDDGYISTVKFAYPILKEYGFRSTIFVIGDTIEREKENFDPRSLQRIHIPEFDPYKDVFKLECHTYALHDIVDGKTKLEVADKDIILADLEKNKEILGTSIIAYPSGRTNDVVIQALKEAGYGSAYTVAPGYVTRESNIYRLPRFIVSPATSFERFQNIVNGNI